MGFKQLQNFFDLGNSSRREDDNSIGEKGHGTKVYFNSRKISVYTSDGTEAHHAVLIDPYRKLCDRDIPLVEVETLDSYPRGTKIEIHGYNNNRRDRFTHEILKDYILWFTKHGSVENQFSKNLNHVTLRLKGLNVQEYETIPQGHLFPKDSPNIDTLFEEYLTKAPHYYVKKITYLGTLKNYPEVSFQAVFCIEGRLAKYSYNPMLRRSGYKAPAGSYTIQERYGLWICKDFIPIQRKNEWITFKGNEYTKFHAFINCQDLRLTANRGSIDNTPSEILHDLKDETRRIYDDIVKRDEWTSIEWLEEEASSYQTAEKEKKNFEWRIKKANRANIAIHKNTVLVEPERESGVYSLFLLLSQLEENLFPFHVIDYDTHEGIDVIAKSDKTTPISNARLFYIEFKKTLSKSFNHSFENLHSVVCWNTEIKHDDGITDINKESRKMKIIPPENEKDRTRYYLEHPRKAHRIEVYCLKKYLKEVLNIDFHPRTESSIL